MMASAMFVRRCDWQWLVKQIWIFRGRAIDDFNLSQGSKKRLLPRCWKLPWKSNRPLKPNIPLESLIVNPYKTPMSPLRRNHSKHSLWTFGVYTVPCDPVSPCQMMIEVDNHLRNEKYLDSITILRFGEPGSLQSTPVSGDSDRIHKLPWLSGWFFQGIPNSRKKREEHTCFN